jgi:Flp pilus assembly protein TadD
MLEALSLEGNAMNARILAIALALGLAGCANQQMPSTDMSGAGAATTGSPTRLQSRMCQVFRSYEDRAAGGELQEACTRQLGAQMCARCLESGF